MDHAYREARFVFDRSGKLARKVFGVFESLAKSCLQWLLAWNIWRLVMDSSSGLLEGDNAAALIQLLSMNVAGKGHPRRFSDFYTSLKMIVRLWTIIRLLLAEFLVRVEPQELFSVKVFHRHRAFSRSPSALRENSVALGFSAGQTCTLR